MIGRMARAFDASRFTEHDECIICLEAFTDKDVVTPLPCSKRHYFHTKCIQDWGKRQKYCPLCTTPFTLAQLLECDRKYSLTTADEFNSASRDNDLGLGANNSLMAESARFSRNLRS